jgi:hypothetical protein
VILPVCIPMWLSIRPAILQELESSMHAYRKGLLGLTHGKHKATPHPTGQETHQLIKELIICLLTEIQAKIQ